MIARTVTEPMGDLPAKRRDQSMRKSTIGWLAMLAAMVAVFGVAACSGESRASVEGAGESRAKEILFHWAKRGEYVLEYLDAVLAVRRAAIAQGAGRKDEAVEEMEKAVESIYNAITTLADVAADQSDRGLIAVLNAYAYRPLVAKLEELAEEGE